MSSNTENTMNMDITMHMVAFIENHGGLDLGEFYKWFEGSSPEEIIRNYNSMLLAKYNKEMRGKLEKINVEKDVSSIKEQLESLPSVESLYETISGLSRVDEDISSIKEQLKSFPSGESLRETQSNIFLMDEDVLIIKDNLKSIPSLSELQTIGGGLSEVKKDMSSIKEQLNSPNLTNLQTVVGGLSRVEEDVSSIKKKLNSIPNTVSGLSEVKKDMSSIKEQLNSLPNGKSLHGAISGLSQVKKDMSSIKEQLGSLPSGKSLHGAVNDLSLMSKDVYSMKEQLGSLPSGKTIYDTIAECKDLKDTIKEMYKTMDVLMNENSRLSSLIENQSSNVSNNQLEWAELVVCHHDLCDFIKKEWINKELTIGYLKYVCCGEHGHNFGIDMRRFDDRTYSMTELSMDEFLLSIERLFKINIPSIYDDVHLHLEIKDVSVTTGTQPLLEIPDQTVGAWLKEIKEFPGKLRANPDSYFLIKRKEIIPPVIFSIISFMVGGPALCYGNPGESWRLHNKDSLLEESNKRQLAWQRDLVKGSSQSI